MTKEEMQKAIGQMSYYNAAEGSYGAEARERNRFKEATAQKAIDAGLSYADFERLYNECNRQLTTFSDFGYTYKRLTGDLR